MAIKDTKTRQKIWDFLISIGCTKFGAAGIMGNLYSESACEPNTVEMLLVQRYDEDKSKYSPQYLQGWKRPVTTEENRTANNLRYSSLIENGTISQAEFLHPRSYTGTKYQYGYGLCQWTTDARKQGLWNYTVGKGKPISDLQGQLDYLKHELENSYKKTFDVLKSATTIAEASDYVLIHFEAPASADSHKATRRQYSQEIYNLYNNRTVNKEVTTTMAKIKGIDVSYHNGSIDWKKVKAAGIKFAVLREGYRKTIDAEFLANAKGCLANEIPLMVYHFIYTDGATIKENAASTVANMKKAGLDITKTWIWADLEYDTWTKNKEKCTKEKCSKYTLDYIKELQALGCKNIGVYMNNDYYKNYYNSDVIKNYPVWLADYSGEPDYSCAIHQYTSSGSVNGINSKSVDMDYMLDSKFLTANAVIKKEKKETNTMTEAQLRQKPVDYLKQYLGISEGSSGHKAILNMLNNSGLCSRYKMTTNDAWCATAVSAAFIANGLAGKPGSGSLFECCECSCYYMVEKAKAQGIWTENDAYVPKTGDVVLYDWDDNGSGDNRGVPDHVGIVVSVSGNTIKVIEGNYSDSVKYRNLAVNGRYIRGYITPNYAKFAGKATTPIIPITPASTENKTYVGKGIGTAIAKATMNIRNGSSTSYSSYGTISVGTKVEVLEILNNGWYKIVWTGAKEGFAYTSNSTNTYYTYTPNKVVTAVTPSKDSAPKDKKTASDTAQNYNKSLAGTYITTTDLNVRDGAGTSKKVLITIPKGTKVNNYGYYSISNGTKWLYIQFTYKNVLYTGFSSSKYLKK